MTGLHRWALRVAAWMTAVTVLLLVVGSFPVLAEEDQVYSRFVDIPGIGTAMYYAQNDPVWGQMRYSRNGDGQPMYMKSAACGPTAVAMAIAAQMSDGGLSAITQSASKPETGFKFCPCGINASSHSGNHEVLTLTTDEEFLTYLPTVIASFAEGNNNRHHKYSNSSGTSLGLLDGVAVAYGIEYRGIRDWDNAVKAMEEGFSVVTTVRKGPFTTGSHFLFIAGVVDDYVYVLDPLMRTEYSNDKQRVLEILEPGVVRAKVKHLARLGFAGYYMVRRSQ